MLEPHQRSLLTEQLQPPRGYELVQAVGTTFTLDLSTALGVPLSFASRNFSDHEDLGIIAALAQHADRLTIFTQAGEIRPGVRSDLVALLEEVVQPVHLTSGIFHPKVWILEYASETKRSYRFLCNSRNLTEDRSWDLSVRLDGAPAREDELATARVTNRPLVAFLNRLPELAVHPLATHRQQQMQSLAERISQVQWELPAGVSEMRFHFFTGTPARPSGPTTAVDEMLDVRAGDALVVSPFLSPAGLERITRITKRNPVVVSRAESLDALPTETVRRLGDTFVFDDLLAADDSTGEGHDALSGLHAKAVFLTEQSRPSRARALIGSANITGGGFARNIEMMVELRGRAQSLGPHAVREALGTMLEPYLPAESAEIDPMAQAERRLEARVRALAAGRIYARVSGTNPYAMHAWMDEHSAGALQRLRNEGATVDWRPLNYTAGSAALGTDEGSAGEVSGLRLTEVTPFLQLTVSEQFNGSQIRVRTVAAATVHDDIDGRRDAVLAHGIADGDQFLKFLSLLLGSEQHALGNDAGRGEQAGSWSMSTPINGLFESLLRSLARADDGLDVAQRVLTQLRAQAAEGLNLPTGFEELWDNVLAARTARTRKARP